MSIIINGMKMPKEGVIVLKIDTNGNVCTTARNDYKKYNAIEVPYHGRLIDADELRSEHGLGTICENCPVDKRYCQYEMIYSKMEVCGWLDDAPTIIPAEGGAGG